MKILQVHKYLYRKAGAEAYVLDLAELLIKNGQEVEMWGTNHNPPMSPLNLRGELKGSYLMEHLNFSKREGLLKDLKKFGHMVWSLAAAKKFDAVLKEFKPDIIHIHNIYHHISPSILSVTKKHKIPVVMTVHDYKLINPNYTLYDHGQICERQGLSAVLHGCIQNSYVASLAGVIEWQTHKWLGVYKKNIARYIAPTEFVKKKLVEGGVEGKKIEVVKLLVNNPTHPPLTLRGGDDRDPPLKVRGGRGSYVLYSGRLVEEKGIYLLLEIAKQLLDIKFKIAGAGPELSRITYHISRNTMRNVELLGFVQKEKLQKLIAGARLVVVPSLWYDPSPLAVLEAMAMGKVVVASRIGGIADLIKDGETGVLITPPRPPLKLRGGEGGVMNWVDAIRKLYYDETLLKRIGQAAGEDIKREHNPEKHYERIMEIYRAIGLPAGRHGY